MGNQRHTHTLIQLCAQEAWRRFHNEIHMQWCRLHMRGQEFKSARTQTATNKIISWIMDDISIVYPGSDVFIVNLSVYWCAAAFELKTKTVKCARRDKDVFTFMHRAWDSMRYETTDKQVETATIHSLSHTAWIQTWTHTQAPIL